MANNAVNRFWYRLTMWLTVIWNVANRLWNEANKLDMRIICWICWSFYSACLGMRIIDKPMRLTGGWMVPSLQLSTLPSCTITARGYWLKDRHQLWNINQGEPTHAVWINVANACGLFERLPCESMRITPAAYLTIMRPGTCQVDINYVSFNWRANCCKWKPKKWTTRLLEKTNLLVVH